MSAEPTDRAMRTKALLGLGVAVALSIAAWIGLSRATTSGVERIAAIERARDQCTRAWSAAKSRAETLQVDKIALPDTIDPRSEGALRQCGDLRSATALPNPREMNGEPMPRGLR